MAQTNQEVAKEITIAALEKTTFGKLGADGLMDPKTTGERVGEFYRAILKAVAKGTGD